MSISLSEIEARNPMGPRRGRYFCPRCQSSGGRTPDLSLDRDRGIYHCFKCGVGGRLTDFSRAPKPRRRTARSLFVAPSTPTGGNISPEYVAQCRRDFPASAADDYERGRGIDGIRTRMGYDPAYPFPRGEEWITEPAVVFFFEDLRGKVVAKQGRRIRETPSVDAAKVTFGRVSNGVFNARALSGPEVILCEGPNTAAALVERGYPAVALGGKSCPEWLVMALANKRVWVGFDHDEPGEAAAEALITRLQEMGTVAERLAPPEAGEDWNDVLRRSPAFILPSVAQLPYEPGLEDIRARCRRLLRVANGSAREMLEEWEFALDSGFEPGRAWWRRNGARLVPLIQHLVPCPAAK